MLIDFLVFFFFKQKTAYEVRISDWSSDVCSSDLGLGGGDRDALRAALRRGELQQSYAQWLSSMGYTDRNLFDVHAAFLMHSWAIANNGVMTRDSKAAFGAVREELAELQAGADAPRTLSRSDARKPEEAPSFALRTALPVSAWDTAGTRRQRLLSNGVHTPSGPPPTRHAA